MTSNIYVSAIDDDIKEIDILRHACMQSQNIILTYTDTSVDHYLNNVQHIQYPHYLFLDIYLDNDNGIAKIPQILKKFPKMEIVLFSSSEIPEDLFQGIKNGAHGYLLKSKSVDNIKDFLSVLKSGGAILSPKMAKYLIQNAKPIEKLTKGRRKLTEKDISLINNLAKGYSYTHIAELEGVSVNTIQGRIKSLYKKLNVTSKIQAINLMTKANLV